MENFVLIGVFVLLGMLFRRLKDFPKDSAQVLNMFALYVSLPALILLKVPQIVFSSEAVVAAVLPWGMLLFSAGLVFLAARVWRWERSTTGVLLLVVPLGNTSFLGVPMIQTFFGTAGQTNVPIKFDAVKGMPQVVAPATAGQITTYFDMDYFGMGKGPGMGMGIASRSTKSPNAGQLFVTHGGMILDSTGTMSSDPAVKTALGSATSSVVMTDLPSGATGTTYGLYAMGWGNGVLAAGKIGGVSLEHGSVSKTMQMF